MTWFKVDDAFWAHPKTLALSDTALALWLRAGSYCAQQLTDGHVRREALPMLRGNEFAADDLVDSGLWHETPQGYVFHDWEKYQPTREGVEEEREAWRQRQRESRAKRAGNVTRDSHRESSSPVHSRPVPSSNELVPSSDADASTREFSDDVIALCDLLAQRISENGNRAPKTVGARWHQAADRLMRVDGYTFEQCRQVLEWSQRDEFWQGNILSMPKFREKFDALKTRMLSERRGSRATVADHNAHVLGRYLGPEGDQS